MTAEQMQRLREVTNSNGSLDDLHTAIGGPPYHIVVENVREGILLWAAIRTVQKNHPGRIDTVSVKYGPDLIKFATGMELQRLMDSN